MINLKYINMQLGGVKMKENVLVILLLVIAMTIPVVVNGEAIAKLEPIKMTVPEGGEVTPLPSSTVLPPGATVTNELASQTVSLYEESMEVEAPEYDETLNWMPDVVSEYAMEYGTIVVVDITNQHVYMCVDGGVIADADCVSGDLYNSPTPTGLYNVWYKRTDFYMMGSYYTAYAVFFNGEIALHDADAWRSEYGGYIYQGAGSHGCVNLPRWFAEIVYNNTWEGTPVYVF